MIAFFDTCVHVDLLRGRLSLEGLLLRIEGGPVRLSPVVASELLRGSTGKARRAIEKLVVSLLPVEPPSWREAFCAAGRLIPAAFRDHEEVGLARLQNDALLAWTARHTGALLVTRDRHFSTFAGKLEFRHLLL